MGFRDVVFLPFSACFYSTFHKEAFYMKHYKYGNGSRHYIICMCIDICIIVFVSAYYRGVL